MSRLTAVSVTWVLPSALVWEGYYPLVLEECLRVEEDGCKGLRGFITSEYSGVGFGLQFRWLTVLSHCRHFTMFCQTILENIQWKDTLFHKKKSWKTYYIFFPITFWTGQSASRKQHFLNENIENVFRTCFCRKRVSLISMFFGKTWWNASSVITL